MANHGKLGKSSVQRGRAFAFSHDHIVLQRGVFLYPRVLREFTLPCIIRVHSYAQPRPTYGIAIVQFDIRVQKHYMADTVVFVLFSATLSILHDVYIQVNATVLLQPIDEMLPKHSRGQVTPS